MSLSLKLEDVDNDNGSTEGAQQRAFANSLDWEQLKLVITQRESEMTL